VNIGLNKEKLGKKKQRKKPLKSRPLIWAGIEDHGMAE